MAEAGETYVPAERTETEARLLRRLLEVALAVAAERRTEPVLRLVLDAARDLTGARYGAVGVPDGDGGFAVFLTAGVDSATWQAIGSLPRTHGLLGALLEDPRPIRLDDIRADPRFQGWPAAHPMMRSFLGVPIVAGGEILAEIYLTERAGGPFTAADQEVVGTLASHAALGIVNSQRLERSRELSVVDERTRLARELHDSVTQTLFSLTLAAESAATLAARGGTGVTDQLDRVRELSAEALAEMRALIGTLRPSDPDREGLATTLRKRIDLLGRVHEAPITLLITGDRRWDGTVEREVMRVASEAVANALRHADAHAIRVELDLRSPLRLAVEDDGRGFEVSDVRRRSRRLGLVSMRERAQALGATLHIDSAPGHGTRVVLEVPGE